MKTTGKLGIAVIGALALSCGCVTHGTNLHVPSKLPVETKLLDVNTDTAQSIVVWPGPAEGRYTLIVAFVSTPEDSKNEDPLCPMPLCPELEGTLTILQKGAELSRVQISSEFTQPCNWLTDDHKLDGAIVKLEDSFGKCKPQDKYSVVLNCSRRSQRIRSLWLSYFEK